jgi:tRNA nucleotidyltransferase (CCA-adding enzyme)
MNGIPDFVRAVLNTLEKAGYGAWLVGGCLRDMLLGRDIHDWDVATTALGAEVLPLFPKTVETGARFGTVTVLTSGGPVEVTTLRSDGTYSDCRRPDSVRFVGDLQEDLKRRDFTVNAMAMTVEGVLSDPFDGRGDLKRRLLRCVGRAEDRFSEDALRMFRALRFSAQLGFEIEPSTMAAIKACAPLCAALSAERVREETEKILMSARPDLVFTAVSLGLFAGRIRTDGICEFPVGVQSALVMHPNMEGDALLVPRATDASRRIAGLPYDRQLRWAAFCAVLQRCGVIGNAPEFLRALRLDAKAVRYCGTGAETAIASPLPEDRTGLKRLLSAIGVEASLCAAAADEVLRGGSAVRRVLEVASSGECFSLGGLAVTGDDLIALGAAPGVQLGTLLKKLLAYVIEHPEDNNRDVLCAFAAEMMKNAVN